MISQVIRARLLAANRSTTAATSASATVWSAVGPSGSDLALAAHEQRLATWWAWEKTSRSADPKRDAA